MFVCLFVSARALNSFNSAIAVRSVKDIDMLVSFSFILRDIYQKQALGYAESLDFVHTVLIFLRFLNERRSYGIQWNEKV